LFFLLMNQTFLICSSVLNFKYCLLSLAKEVG
jgi:hypothetical protein